MGWVKTRVCDVGLRILDLIRFGRQPLQLDEPIICPGGYLDRVT